MQKTFSPKIQSKDQKKWFLVDLDGKVLGRAATEIAVILRGKNKPSFSGHVDAGDYVVVINVDKVKLTGRKEEQKEYIHHTGYLGHLRRKTAAQVRAQKPEKMLFQAVSGMIPRNRLRKRVLSKLMIYSGAEHPHAGQNPTPINL